MGVAPRGELKTRSCATRRSSTSPLLGDDWARTATQRLQTLCSALGLPRYTWHAFRRGGASDLLRRGGTVAHILLAGGWRSASFLKYLRNKDLDARAALEAAYKLSDSE